MKISEYFKKIRKEKGLRIVDYCKVLGISHTTLGRIEKGYYDNPSVTQVCRICKMMCIEPNELKQFDFSPTDEYIESVIYRLTHDINKKSTAQYDLIKRMLVRVENKLSIYDYSKLNNNQKKLLLNRFNNLKNNFYSYLKEV